MRFRHWYWIFTFVLFVSMAGEAFTSGSSVQILFGYLFAALSLHSVWMLMTGHPTVFEREYWESIKSDLDG